MDGVQSAIDEYQKFISLHKPLLSSHRRFPPEIWCYIFDLAVTSNQETAWRKGTRHPKPNLIPLNLSQVCTNWRRLALQLPSLWHSIRIDIEDSFTESRMKLLSAFILRSRNNPLDIIIWVSTNQAMLSCCTRLRLIFREAHRWNRVRLTVPFQFFLPRNSLFPIIRAPMLSRLDIKAHESSSILPSDFSFVREAPALSELELYNLSIPLESINNLIEWKSLTHFSCFAAPSPQESGILILSLAPKLERWLWNGHSSSHNSQPVTHGRIKYALTCLRDSASLSLFVFPSLLVAHILFASVHSDGGLALHNFLRHSANLRTIHFDRCQNLDLREIFTSGSLLSVEELKWTIMDVQHISALPSDSSIPLFFRENMPTLRTLAVNCRALTSWDDAETYWPIPDLIRQLAFQPPTRYSPTVIHLYVTRSQLHGTTLAALLNIRELKLPNVYIDFF
ncbi:hypothetical protein DL96DRAFT_1631384 [Flagelloscypha sp. PMI_526]|nr:hypothetical protein DL96DRAFT_1631384 [Flagelloscypha sp. PMI_526]